MNACQPIAQPSELDLAAQALRDAKAAEDAARSARIAIEDTLIALIALVGVKGEGTTTVKTAFFKISTVGKLNRSLDTQAYAALAERIPSAIRDRLVRWKPELVLAELRHVENNEPAIYAVLAQALTVKPAKPAVSVDLL